MSDGERWFRITKRIQKRNQFTYVTYGPTIWHLYRAHFSNWSWNRGDHYSGLGSACSGYWIANASRNPQGEQDGLMLLDLGQVPPDGERVCKKCAKKVWPDGVPPQPIRRASDLVPILLDIMDDRGEIARAAVLVDMAMSGHRDLLENERGKSC